MVKILKSGYKKEFVRRCPECATDFIYMRYDVKSKRGYGQQIYYSIECPQCHATMKATFEDYTGDYTDETDEE